MCGIVGGNNLKWNFEEAVNLIYHRGPNAQRVEKIAGMGLGFARLAIIDLSETAMQPMISEDGHYAIIFNGEIYGFDSIRKELENKGYHFRTKSDTEVLLYSFIEWREKMMDHLDGIFAFAIYDMKNEKVYLFRDRSGVKPMYYLYDGSNFAFASELKAIHKLCNNLHFLIDESALYDYHTYLYIPAPKTMYKNVYKLEAATYLVFDVKNRRIEKKEKYWKVRLNTKVGNILTKRQLGEKAEELRYHLDRVIDRQIIADVPVGTFLSGGVDSSIITTVTREKIRDVTAYTIGFEDRRYDESSYAKEIADIINVDCRIKKFVLKDYDKLYHILPEMFDEPFADTSAYPSYFVSQFAKQDITVVLTGDGGDELFGGYPRCTFVKEILDGKVISNQRLSQFYLAHKEMLKQLGNEVEKFCEEDIALLAPQYTFSVKPNRKVLREKYHIPKDYDDFWYLRKYYYKDLPPFTRMRYLDFMTYLDGDILTKVDRTSMRVSLESRVPFLDKEMIDFAFSLTQEECNPKGQFKGLLKLAYEHIIPRKLFERRKQGFSIPFSYLRKGKNSPQESLIKELWGL